MRASWFGAFGDPKEMSPTPTVVTSKMAILCQGVHVNWAIDLQRCHILNRSVQVGLGCYFSLRVYRLCLTGFFFTLNKELTHIFPFLRCPLTKIFYQIQNFPCLVSTSGSNDSEWWQEKYIFDRYGKMSETLFPKWFPWRSIFTNHASVKLDTHTAARQ